jgi:hypothetical protein
VAGQIGRMLWAVALAHRLRERPVSECGRLRHGDGDHEGGNRRRRVLMLPSLTQVPVSSRLTYFRIGVLGVACSMLGRRRGEREALCYRGRTCTALSVMALAKSPEVDATGVSRSVARVERRLGNDEALGKGEVVDAIVSA